MKKIPSAVIYIWRYGSVLGSAHPSICMNGKIMRGPLVQNGVNISDNRHDNQTHETRHWVGGGLQSCLQIAGTVDRLNI